jgi:hypothetical protein
VKTAEEKERSLISKLSVYSTLPAASDTVQQGGIDEILEGESKDYWQEFYIIEIAQIKC